MTDSRPTARLTSSPVTSLLRYVLADDQRTGRAQRLLVTAACCMTALFAVLASIALFANDMVGWVPIASGGGAFTMLGIVTRRVMVHRRRQHDL